MCELGIPELLLQELKNEHEQTHEQVMAALLCLAKEHPPTQQALAKPELKTKQFLQQRIQFLRGKEENNASLWSFMFSSPWSCSYLSFCFILR